jgi:hypothetical protein
MLVASKVFSQWRRGDDFNAVIFVSLGFDGSGTLKFQNFCTVKCSSVAMDPLPVGAHPVGDGLLSDADQGVFHAHRPRGGLLRGHINQNQLVSA